MLDISLHGIYTMTPPPLKKNERPRSFENYMLFTFPLNVPVLPLP